MSDGSVASKAVDLHQEVRCRALWLDHVVEQMFGSRRRHFSVGVIDADAIVLSDAGQNGRFVGRVDLCEKSGCTRGHGWCEGLLISV